MRSIWKGTISFGLVNIPVSLYSAVQKHSIGFKLLHDRCHTPIEYKRWCPHCKEEVPFEHVVKGLPLEDGSYLIMTQENLKKLKPAKSDSISIIEFVNLDAIDPLYIDSHYYVMPSKDTDRAFFLFSAALAEKNRVAIGQFIMRDKEHVCALLPYKSGLLMHTLNYDYEIKALPKLDELKKPKILPAELNLAEEIINRLYVKKLDMGKFKDTFVERIKEAVRKKGKIVKPKEKVAPQAPQSLIDALKASLSQYEQTQAISRR